MELTDSVDEKELLDNMPPMLKDTHFYKMGPKYRGKVRDNYTSDGKRVIVATDRLSAFDRIITTIPFKGQLLNQTTAFWFEETKNIAPNHVVGVPDPNVMITKQCEPIKVEMIVRGYLTGSSWRTYEKAKERGVTPMKSGVELPRGMRKDERFDEPILTPSTKEEFGIHDVDISRGKILESGLVSKKNYEQMEEYSLALFEKGTEICAKQGIILVDTKYEFGIDADGNLTVIDEIHTQDSSRFWVEKRYEDLFEKGETQSQLDKEFGREALMEEGFMGDGRIPTIDKKFWARLARRYVTLYEKLTGRKFDAGEAYASSIEERIAGNLADLGYDTSPYATVPIVMGSEKDMDYAQSIGEEVKKWNIDVEYHVASAHKAPKWLSGTLDSLEARGDVHGIVAIAGLSNGLGPSAGAHTGLPVITTTPTDSHDARYNSEVMSAVLAPSNAPVGFVGGRPVNVALQAVKQVGSAVPDLKSDIKFYLDRECGRL